MIGLVFGVLSAAYGVAMVLHVAAVIVREVISGLGAFGTSAFSIGGVLLGAAAGLALYYIRSHRKKEE